MSRSTRPSLRHPDGHDRGRVREVALPLGLVDNKVAAIDETWSGLRRELAEGAALTPLPVVIAPGRRAARPRAHPR